jgi:hypothetical protein
VGHLENLGYLGQDREGQKKATDDDYWEEGPAFVWWSHLYHLSSRKDVLTKILQKFADFHDFYGEHRDAPRLVLLEKRYSA